MEKTILLKKINKKPQKCLYIFPLKLIYRKVKLFSTTITNFENLQTSWLDTLHTVNLNLQRLAFGGVFWILCLLIFHSAALATLPMKGQL